MALDIETEDAYVPDEQLPPLNLPDDEAGSVAPAAGVNPLEVTEEKLRRLLRLFYRSGGWITRDRDIWTIEDEELDAIAQNILPDIAASPALSQAVRAAGTVAGWTLLIFSFFGRVKRSLDRRGKKKQQQEVDTDAEFKRNRRNNVEPEPKPEPERDDGRSRAPADATDYWSDDSKFIVK
jgi:hypothetical protein